MVQIDTGRVTLEVEKFGRQEDPALVLIAGLGFQLIDWPEAFCKQLADSGFQVLRFDNRDVGLSEKFDAKGVPDLEKAMAAKAGGRAPELPYSLTDMAEDVIALLDQLGLEKAHMVGMSMGGMIVQLLGGHFPERCLSLTSIMSSSGEASVSVPHPDAMAVLTQAPASQEKSDIVEFGLMVNDTIGSPGFRWNRSALKAHIEACFDRGYCPTGYLRQMGAVFSAGSRRELLKTIPLKTLVIHGKDDRLVPPSAGQDTADHIPGARFELVEGMGHDLSPSLCDHLAALIRPHVMSAG
ncbi:alpha/beta fold hydrolase [Sneathiella sp.]|jgi:pimeloyl-ACP methyl ester carboxylesterase|uniref:alpha/beta fold hydrolase n=1 Tax=Sneathiella sp. TaxID=1964365 RepID=UPI0039E6F6DC